jgi:hypothetical protein
MLIRNHSWHPTDKPARVLVFDQRQPYADMAATRPWASQVFGDFIKAHVAVGDLYKKLHRALQPYMQTPHARCL